MLARCRMASRSSRRNRVVAAVAAGRAILSTKLAPTGSITPANTIGTVRFARCSAPTMGLPPARMTSGSSNHFGHVLANKVWIGAHSEAVFEPDVAPFNPSQLLQRLLECRIAGCGTEIADTAHYADAPHSLGLLRARNERPRDRRAAEQRDELAAVHSITSSACSRPLKVSTLDHLAKDRLHVFLRKRSQGLCANIVYGANSQSKRR